MAERQTLTTFEGATDEFGMLCPDAGPALGGHGGIDWHCNQCGVLLLEGMYERQVLNVLVRCHACGSILATPRREPGEPLAGRPLLFPAGRYRLSSQVRNDGAPMMMVGGQALDGYLHETGLGELSESGLHPLEPIELSAGFLRALASEATALLDEHFDRLKAADERGQSSPVDRADRRG